MLNIRSRGFTVHTTTDISLGMLIKFSKQIGDGFGEFKTQSNSWDGAFSTSPY